MATIETELVIDSGRAIVSLGGALDVSNAHRLGSLLRRLVREGCDAVVVEMGAVSRIDAAGVGILRGAASAVARAGGGSFTFRNARPDVRDYLVDNGLREHTERTEIEGTARPARTTKFRSAPEFAMRPDRRKGVPSDR